MQPIASMVVVSMLLGAGGPQEPPGESPQPAVGEALPDVDPKALGALQKMEELVRDQRSMAISIRAETDEVLENGQKIRMSSAAELKVRRPDRLRADLTSDRKVRELYYDGKTFTVFGPRVGYYATVPAPRTLEQLTDILGSRYGIDLPFADVVYWGTERSGIDTITSAIDLGPSTVDGVECEQYAFRQPGLDWQVWIEQGPQALPRKLLLTTTSDPAMPEHVMWLKWKLDPPLPDRAFTFARPPGAYRIELEPITGMNVD
jgi:hypothetical protein